MVGGTAGWRSSKPVTPERSRCPVDAALVLVAELHLRHRRLDQHLALCAGEHLVEEFLHRLVLLRGRAHVEDAALAVGDDRGGLLVGRGRLRRRCRTPAAGQAAAPGRPGAAAAGVACASCAPAGMTLSVSRRMSFTFCDSDSHSLFSAMTSICAVPPVVVVVVGVVAVPPVPNCVEAVDCIFTLRVALR